MLKIAIAVVLFSLAFSGVSAWASEESLPTHSATEPSHLELSYDAGLLSGRANAANLTEILEKLEQIPGLEVERRYVPTAEDKASFRFTDKPLRNAAKDLLPGYDYFITGSGKSGETLRLILLGPAAPPPAEPATEGQPPPIAEVPDPVQESEEEQAEDEEPPELRGLEDFWPLTRAQTAKPSPEKENTSDRQLSEEERAAIELQRHQERQERVERSGAVLASEYNYLHQDAIADLEGVDHPQATATLRAAAVGELGAGDDLKAMSAESLWRHAADLKFANPAANQALLELATSDDADVRRVAKRALQDMEHYLIRQQEEAEAAEAARASEE